MARIIPIDVIKGMSGKYGSKSNDYFATNGSSGRVYLAKITNPYTGDPTEAQKMQQMKFKERQTVATAWLNANRPSEANGPKGTPLYQQAQKLKRTFRFSNVTQVLYKYMDAENMIQLPGMIESGSGGSGSDSGGETPVTKYTIQGVSANSSMGSVAPASTEVERGASVTLTATPLSGYKFSQWDDGNTDNPRTVVAEADKTYTASFAEESGDDGPPFS